MASLRSISSQLSWSNSRSQLSPVPVNIITSLFLSAPAIWKICGSALCSSLLHLASPPWVCMRISRMPFSRFIKKCSLNRSLYSSNCKSSTIFVRGMLLLLLGSVKSFICESVGFPDSICGRTGHAISAASVYCLANTLGQAAHIADQSGAWRLMIQHCRATRRVGVYSAVSITPKRL